ncbi:hypothetical protein [Pedobacter heparinus]|uniref:hypothetical protein n=1 Tax=Pedobacter heparinus TaxID=984 RepID=UPI002931A8E8|nr:hypothetical protein [Pedobacter heparinus]
MNGLPDFDCHDFFENTNLCILEISTYKGTTGERKYKWLLINKLTLSVKIMLLKNQDNSSVVHERFFDLGFLKYKGNSGVFIEADAKDLHHLEHKGCENIPQHYLTAVSKYLNANLVE